METPEQLRDFEDAYLGKKSPLQNILALLKELPAEERADAGAAVQAFRQQWQQKIQAQKEQMEREELNKKLEQEWVDVSETFPAYRGSLHPISLVQREVEQVFTGLGFEIIDGPQMETEWRNFDALNVPGNHPARDMQDTFWIDSSTDSPHTNTVLRTHTSNMQIRYMQEHGAPCRIICPGRVFRNEATDATHDAVFYQVEGLMVDEHISVAHLKGVMKTMLSEIFGRDVSVRIRPGYFPFVEPGLEVDFQCPFCMDKEEVPSKNNQESDAHMQSLRRTDMSPPQTGRPTGPGHSPGCRICKYSGYIEFSGAGMVHPNVFRACGVDPEKYTGFAFGFGLTRLAMMRYAINDARLLGSISADFLRQFPASFV